MRRAAFVLAGVWLAGLLAAWGLEALPAGLISTDSSWDWLVLAGGPAVFAGASLFALWKEREAGALLWLGAAVAAVGLSLRSGPHLGSYFLGMGLLVLPQVAAGTLFLLHARGRQAAPPAARPRRR